MSETIAEYLVGLLVAILAFYWGVKAAPVLLRAFLDWLQQRTQDAESLDPSPPTVIDGEVSRHHSTGPRVLP